MRFKCKLSFSVLMISSCFVQIANAGEKENGELKNISKGRMTVGQKVPKGSTLSTFLFSNRTMVLDGGVEIVENGGNAMEAIIEKGGMQTVTRGGTAINAVVRGGQQLVFEEGSFFKLKNVHKHSSAYYTIVSGMDGSIGQQNLYDGGIAWGTKVESKGEQNLYTGNGNIGGFASNTKVSGTGRQHILAGGMAENITLVDKAVQIVYPGGQINGLTINDYASSWLHVGAVSRGAIEVSDHGHLYLYAGDKKNHITKKRLSVVGRSDEDLFFVGMQNGSSIYLEKLGGEGGTVDFSSVPYDPRRLSLHVGQLSGELHFNFNIDIKNNRGDYLVINGEGAGEHTVSVTDSGSEFTDSLSQKNGAVRVYLVTDRSGSKDVNFTLVRDSGEKTSAIDGGTYMYGLYKTTGSSIGSPTMWYLGTKADSHSSDVSSLRTKSRSKTKPKTSTPDASANKPQSHSNFASNFPSWTAFMRNTETLKPKERPPRHLKENLPALFHPISSLSEEQPVDSIVDADGNENGVLTVISRGKEVLKGSALISTRVNTDVIVKNGGVEIVENGMSSMKSTVERGGMQIVTRKGTAINTKIHGGTQLVFEEESFRHLKEIAKHSSAYETEISGVNGTIGQQNVYDGGEAWHTVVLSGGEQNLYTGNSNIGGSASNTIVSGTGRQHVLAGGTATNTTLRDQAVQIVYPDGKINGLTIDGGASSWLHAGARILTKEIKVNKGGDLYLYAGDSTNFVTGEQLLVEDRSSETIFHVGKRDSGKRSWFLFEKLSGDGGNVRFISILYDKRHLSLRVEDLSGSLNFYFNINATGNGYSKYNGTNEYSNYLLINKGEGSHKISVADSGTEITDFFSKNDMSSSHIVLVADRTENGGASFTLADYSGKEIKGVDGGTFMYGLHKGNMVIGTGDNITVWYLGTKNDAFSLSSYQLSYISEQSKEESTAVNVSQLPHQSSSRSRRRGFAAGNGNVRERDKVPRLRTPRHLRGNQQVSISSSENQAVGSSRLGNRSQSPSQKLQPVTSLASRSLADEMITRPSVQDSLLLQVKQDEEIKVSDFLTTPSTDAVLSMAVAPALIFNNEVQTVRSGRGILDRSKKNASLWTYAIKSKEHVATGHTDFNLEQTGIVLGVNGLSELTNGEFYIGGFGGYDQARVAHARGGTSGINSYSIGTYVTYFDHSGWYLDGVLKYNHYKNNLKAISTNGLSVQGDYTQWAVGTSFEAGYRFKTTQNSWMQPYAHLTWLQVEGKEIKLSHGMKGDISRSVSLRSEVGLSLGYEFGSGTGTSSMAYITAAWLRENINNNHTTINKHHKFITDLSGNFGKLGIGLSGSVSDRLKLYAEGHYLKGRKVKQSLQGVLGIRYSF
ncbi:BafA family autotransporter [Bartonella sp. CB74]|uniref:BafA family autotransporter n=1 Tax=Bartonella sp. CB74 TaxID=3113620 RepID=UPI002F96A9E8